MTETSPAPGFLARCRAVWREAGERLSVRLRYYSDDMLISGVVLIVLLIFLMPSMVITIPAGHLGVLWKRFGGGTVLDKMLPEGTSLVLPWDRVFVYDARIQSVDREFEVLTSDGLTLKVDLAWRYRVIPKNLGKLHQYAGPDYPETLLAPTIGARARDVIAIYSPEDIYTEHRLEIQNQIAESVRYDLQHRFNMEGEAELEWALVEDVLIKRIRLPEGVQESIVRKNKARHEVEEYALIVAKEKQESERKRVEALGIRNFQEIVNGGMSESYLRLRGIEATLELARSNNAKVVVMGNEKNGGLPIISISGDTAKLNETPNTVANRPRSGDQTRNEAVASKPQEVSKELSGDLKQLAQKEPKFGALSAQSDKSPHTGAKVGAR